MYSLKEIRLKCNKQFIVNFDGWELSSDGGLLLIKEFLHALGFEALLKTIGSSRYIVGLVRPFIRDGWGNDSIFLALTQVYSALSRCNFYFSPI